LLVFLGFDALEEALEAAADVPGPYQGPSIILIGFSLSLGLLYAASGWLRRRQESSGTAGALVLAYSIAFGIGVHNLGEGLAIGAAYSVGDYSGLVAEIHRLHELVTKEGLPSVFKDLSRKVFLHFLAVPEDRAWYKEQIDAIEAKLAKGGIVNPAAPPPVAIP